MRVNKFLILAVMIVIALSAAGRLLAEGVYNRDPGYRVKIEVIEPVTETPALSTTIIAGNSVLGFTYTDTAAGTVGLSDSSSISTAMATYYFGEASVAAGTAETVIFPFPKKVDRGVVTNATTSTGMLMVYYE